MEIAFVALAKNGGSESELSLSSVIVNFVLQKDGVERARDMYRRYVYLLLLCYSYIFALIK